MTSTTAHCIAGRRLPGRGNHAATDVFWLSTVAIFCQPSTLRNLICPLDHEAEEQDHRRVLGGQRALRFHASAKFLMEPLNRVGGSQCLPLLFREPEERQELLAAFPQARHHTRAALAPGALEERVGSASRLSIGRVDDSMEVVADLGKRA